jgi:hypothetical protein
LDERNIPCSLAEEFLWQVGPTTRSFNKVTREREGHLCPFEYQEQELYRLWKRCVKASPRCIEGSLRRDAVSDFRLRTAPAAGMRVIVGLDLAGLWRSAERLGLDEDTLTQGEHRINCGGADK